MKTSDFGKSSNFLDKYYKRTGPGLSTNVSKSTFQDMAKMMSQVSFLGFIVRYEFNSLTYCSL